MNHKLKKNNKLDKTFGPFAFTGLVIFLVISGGVFYEILSSVSRYGYPSIEEIHVAIKDITLLALIILGVLLVPAFIAFTTSCTIIDYANKKMKYATQLFGIIPIGKWTHLTSDMKLGLKKSTERWGAYSMSNRSTSFDYDDVKIVLYDAEETELIPVKKIKKAKNAELELEKLCEILGLERI